MNLVSLLVAVVAAHSADLAGAEQVFHVAPHGDDAWSGLFEQPVADASDGPFATLQQAQRAVRVTRAAADGQDVSVQIQAGVYALNQPLVFTPQDGGDSERTVTWRAAPGARVVVSGGRSLDRWEVAADGTWTHPAVSAGARQLFVSGVRRPRARWPQVGWLRVEAPGTDGRTSFVYAPGDLAAWPDVASAELLFVHDWSTSRVAIERVDAAARTLHLAQAVGAWHPFFHITGFEAHPRYALENVAVGWDAPGEWYLDQEHARIQYRPRAGEDPVSSAALVPILARLVEIRGQPGQPVRALRFEGITFAHTRAADPPGGYAGIQAAFHEGRAEGAEAQRERPSPSAVFVTDAVGFRFENCQFRQLGGTALWIGEGCRDGLVRACTLADVGANGLMVGSTREPDHDQSERLTASIVCEDNTIERCGVLCLGAVGLWVGLAADVTIRHNELRDLPYTGISLGWIWDPRPSLSRGHRIERNHIHHVMQVLSDGGGIYTLGRQEQTRLSHNLIHDVPPHQGRAQSNGFFIDEGSSELVIEGNVVHSIAGSPIRFHRAGPNRLQANVLVTPTQTAPYTYNSCSAELMSFAENRIVRPAAWEAPAKSELNVGPR